MLYRFDSPLGAIIYAWDGAACQRVVLEHKGHLETNNNPLSHWLTAYFNRAATSLPPLIEPATLFRKRVQEALLKIPFGEVCTYGEIARQLDTAPRAVGQALGANQLPILIPCHRVIAADGPGGFAFGDRWKRRLLEFEQGA